MQTNLKITSKNMDTDKTVTNTVSYVNPNLDDTKAKELAQRLANFSTDSYVKTDRIDTKNLDTETKYQRALTVLQYQSGNNTFTNVPEGNTINITKSQIYASSAGATFALRFRTQEQEVFPVVEMASSIETTIKRTTETFTNPDVSWSNANTWLITTIADGVTAQDIQPQTISATITLPATDNYEEFSFTVNWVITE